MMIQTATQEQIQRKTIKTDENVFIICSLSVPEVGDIISRNSYKELVLEINSNTRLIRTLYHENSLSIREQTYKMLKLDGASEREDYILIPFNGTNYLKHPNIGVEEFNSRVRGHYELNNQKLREAGL